MASVSIKTGPITADLSPRDVPVDKWFNLLLARRSAVHVNIPYDCRSLLRYVKDAEEFRMWEHTGHDDLKAYIRDGLNIDPELLEWAKLGLAAFEEGAPVPFKLAVDIGKSRQQQAEQTRLAVESALTAHPDATHQQIADVVELSRSRVTEIVGELSAKSEHKLLNHGGNRGEQGNHNNLERGTHKAYLLARLVRDGHGDLAEQVKQGKVSARAAGLKVGFIKPESALTVAKRSWKKMTPEEQGEFRRWISNEA